MALKCGIIGLANVGKTTLFNCISNNKAEVNTFSKSKSNLGIISVPDSRLYKINEFIKSPKIIHTTIEIVDIPGLSKGSDKDKETTTKFLTEIRETDALIHVLRCFDDEQNPHIDGKVDPVRDIENVNLQLQFRDLESIDKKIVRMEKGAKANNKDAAKSLEVLLVYKKHLESFQPASTLDVKEEDKKHVEDICLLSDKPVIYVCNVDEKSIVNGNDYVNAVIAKLKETNEEPLIIGAKTESEISELESAEDREMFLNDIGLKEPGVNKVIQSAYKLLNLSSFFTAGPKEVRAWTIKTGMTAPQAAGVIHSDLEKGFIRAELMKYNDFITLGSEAACKEHGKFHVVGKTYIIDDGDIINIRFNV